jgi:hypothetical protein
VINRTTQPSDSTLKDLRMLLRLLETNDHEGEPSRFKQPSIVLLKAAISAYEEYEQIGVEYRPVDQVVDSLSLNAVIGMRWDKRLSKEARRPVWAYLSTAGPYTDSPDDPYNQTSEVIQHHGYAQSYLARTARDLFVANV